MELRPVNFDVHTCAESIFFTIGLSYLQGRNALYIPLIPSISFMPFFPFLSIISRFGLYLFFLFSFFEERFGLYLIVECEDRSLYAVLVGERADFFLGYVSRERERDGGACSAMCYQMVLSIDLSNAHFKSETKHTQCKQHSGYCTLPNGPTRATVHTTNVDIF